MIHNYPDGCGGPTLDRGPSRLPQGEPVRRLPAPPPRPPAEAHTEAAREQACCIGDPLEPGCVCKCLGGVK